MKAFILQATYQTKRADPALSSSEYPEVQLYAKTEDGKPVVLVTNQFAPYFYCEDRQNAKNMLRYRDEVRKMESMTLESTGGPKQVLKVWTYVPRHVAILRSELKYIGVTSFASDILFGLRFMYDMDIGPYVEATGRWLDDSTFFMEHVEDVPPFKVPLTVMSFDIEASPHDDHIHCLCWTVRYGDATRDRGKIWSQVANDGEVLSSWVDTIERVDPDVITGYNIFGYDFLKCEERADLYGVRLGVGRDGSRLRAYRNKDDDIDRWTTQGRLLVDTWQVVRQEKYVGSQSGKGEKWTLQPQEDLNTIATLMGFDGKKDVDASNIDEEWEADHEKVLEYCLHDAELVLDIFEKLGTAEKATALAELSRQPAERCFVARSSWLIDPILIREADRIGWLVPANRFGQVEEEEDKIEGAYVKDPVAGLHEWVVSLDYKSMYPSTIIAKNICFTTFTTRRTNVHQSPCGGKFIKQEEREGILPNILKGLLQTRAWAKKKFKETGDQYYNRLQESVKILMNSFFGILASNFYRFTNRMIGESITTWAKEKTIELVEGLEEEGITVLIADTDSSYMLAPVKREQDAILWGEKLAKKYSTESLILELEKVFRRFFCHGRKKRYAGTVVHPEEFTYIRGYELRRGDSFAYQREVLGDVLNTILDGRPDDAMVSAVEAVRLLHEGGIQSDELIITKSCRVFSEYKRPDSMPQVQAARKLMELGYPWTPGHKVAWVVTNGKTPQQVEPVVPDRDIEPDYEYYTKRILNTLCGSGKKDPETGWVDRGIVGVFGYDRITMLTGMRPTTLEEWA